MIQSGPYIARAAHLAGIKPGEIVGPSRLRVHAWPRFGVAWALRRQTRMSMTQIGRALGGRDHTSIVYAVQRAEELREADVAYRAMTDRLVAA